MMFDNKTGDGYFFPEGTRVLGGDGLPAAFNLELTYNIFKRPSIRAKVG